MAENNLVGQEDNSIAPSAATPPLERMPERVESGSVAIERQRDERGKFKPKPNPEFTLSHFWLEVMEIAIGILIAQTIWEGGVWIMK